jgi:Single-strand binding protein family
VVDEASAARWREGERRRQERVRRRESQRERAAPMGIPMEMLNGMSTDGSSTGVHGARGGQQPPRSYVSGVLDDASGSTVINYWRNQNNDLERSNGNRTPRPEAGTALHPASGAAVTGFSVATSDVFLDEQRRKRERVDWHNILVFGKLAETCAKYLDKGREVYVEGTLADASMGAQQRRVQAVPHRDCRIQRAISRRAPH